MSHGLHDLRRFNWETRTMAGYLLFYRFQQPQKSLEPLEYREV